MNLLVCMFSTKTRIWYSCWFESKPSIKIVGLNLNPVSELLHRVLICKKWGQWVKEQSENFESAVRFVMLSIIREIEFWIISNSENGLKSDFLIWLFIQNFFCSSQLLGKTNWPIGLNFFGLTCSSNFSSILSVKFLILTFGSKSLIQYDGKK